MREKSAEEILEEIRNKQAKHNHTYYYAHRDELLEKKRNKYALNINGARDKASEYAKKNKDILNEKQRIRYKEHRDEILARQRKYTADHKDKIKATQKKYYANNHDKIRKYHYDYTHSIPDATNRRSPWTDYDISVALDRSISIKEAAMMLGRSYYSVSSARVKFNNI